MARQQEPEWSLSTTLRAEDQLVLHGCFTAERSSCLMARKKRSRQSETAHDAEQTIRLRAYELFEARGRTHGHALDDWLRAEQDIKAKIHVAA